MARVPDKIALVTGAAAGIGRAAALALAREGAHIVATDIDLDGAEDVAEEVRRGNRGAIAVRHDVSLEHEWKTRSTPRSTNSAGSTFSSTMPE